MFMTAGLVVQIANDIAAANAVAEAYIKADNHARKTLNPEQYAERRERLEALRLEREKRDIEERRHRETIASIRSTSFWRFGG